MHIGPQDNLPSDVKNNKARNTYYFLPLILGLIGLVFQFKRDKNNFWVLLVFFLFTGIALKIYLNERPFEPRERDYALVGSFYVFAIWIGFGAYALFDWAKKFLKPKLAAPIVIAASILSEPVLLASENWDDHDRSGRDSTLTMAKMYLDSIDENGIIFTIGDNDTFALWYVQQIERYRTDVRVVNTSLFATDWYIDQMKRKAFDSDPIPSQFENKDYNGVNDAVFAKEVTRDTLPIKTWLNYIQNDDPRTKAELQSGQMINTFPSKNIRIPVDKEAVLENGIVEERFADQIVDEIVINLDSQVIYKNTLMMLDILANNNWERPIYFSGGSFNDEDYLWMKEFLQLEGVAYKLVPIKTAIDKRNPYDMGRINTNKMYDIVMNWDWGNMGSDDIYHDTETRRNSITYRSNLARLVENLLNEQDTTRAKNVLDLAMENMPVEHYSYYALLEPYVSGYYDVGEPEKAREIWEKIATSYQEKLQYYSTWDVDRQYRYFSEIVSDIERYRALVDLLVKHQDEDILKEKADEFNEHLELFRHFYGEEDEIDPQDPQESLLEEGINPELNQGNNSLRIDSSE